MDMDKELAKKILQLSRSGSVTTVKKKEYLKIPVQEIEDTTPIVIQMTSNPIVDYKKTITVVENGKILNNVALDRFIDNLVK